MDTTVYRTLIDKCNAAIVAYDAGEPVMADVDYDKLFSKLLEFERQCTPATDSPTQKVGDVVTGRKNIKHKYPLLSLDNVFNETELLAWMDNAFQQSGETLMLAELKMDGLAISLEYVDGVLRSAATRGDGMDGEDVYSNIKHVASIPLVLKEPMTISVKGELVMLRDDFNRVNKALAECKAKQFVNPRNAIAGIIRGYNSAATKISKPTFYAYELIGGTSLPYGDRTSMVGNVDILKTLGFNTSLMTTTCNGADSCIDFYNEVLAERSRIPHDIDGVVFKINNTFKHHTLGTTSRFPKYAIAFKLPPEEATTILEDIVLQIGRTGVITPVAKIKPVFVGGVTISSVTLHNSDEIDRLDLRIGDTIFVHRAGDVIPKITRVVESLRSPTSNPYRFPKECPCCNSSLVLESTDDVYIYCPNVSCKQQLKQTIAYVASRPVLDIDGLGGATAELLINENGVTDISQVFRLTQINGLSELMSDKVIANINQAKECRLENFIAALCINDIGSGVAKEIANYFGTYERFLHAGSTDFPLDIPSVGKGRRQSIVKYFELNFDLICNMHNSGFKHPEPIRLIESEFTGKTVVITGSFPEFSRQEIKIQLEILGAKVTDTVSTKTDFLVCGDNAGTKLEKAKSLAVVVITDLTTIMGP